MFAVISPAKTLDYKTPTPVHETTSLLFPDAAAALVDVMRHYTPTDLQALMGISERLAQLNAQRFSEWQWPFKGDDARAAVYAFKGDVYAGLDAYSLAPPQLSYLNAHVRILSGLYGLLRPTDAIMPYRLEMGKKITTERGSDIYSYWGDRLAARIKADLAESGDGTLVNLASNEYFRSIAPYLGNTRVVTPVFKDWKNGQYKIISFYAKKARGLMVRFMAENAVIQPSELKAFNSDGYTYDAKSSTNDDWVFLRRQDA